VRAVGAEPQSGNPCSNQPLISVIWLRKEDYRKKGAGAGAGARERTKRVKKKGGLPETAATLCHSIGSVAANIFLFSLVRLQPPWLVTAAAACLAPC
jgi:hypothetical protein